MWTGRRTVEAFSVVASQSRARSYCGGQATCTPNSRAADKQRAMYDASRMLQLRDLAGLAEPEREALARDVGPLRTLHDVIGWGRIANVVVQDEFTHDAVVERGGRYLVFDST